MFCLPSSYRKDVPPQSKNLPIFFWLKKSIFQFFKKPNDRCIVVSAKSIPIFYFVGSIWSPHPFFVDFHHIHRKRNPDKFLYWDIAEINHTIPNSGYVEKFFGNMIFVEKKLMTTYFKQKRMCDNKSAQMLWNGI